MAAGGNFPHPNPPFAASLAVDQEDEEISKLPTAFANALPERKTKSPSLPPPYAINGGHSTSAPPSLPAINASRVDAEGVSKPPPLEMDPIRTSAGSPSPVTFHSGPAPLQRLQASRSASLGSIDVPPSSASFRTIQAVPPPPESDSPGANSAFVRKRPSLSPDFSMEESRSRPSCKQCNCKKSSCLKLYCECFAARRLCEGCNCTDCKNTKEHEALVNKTVAAILERNPTAFRPKITASASPGSAEARAGRHQKGCHCRKSNCLKKYCECYQANILCGDNCKCLTCKNYEGSQERRALLDDGVSRLSPTDMKKPRSHEPSPVPPAAAAAVSPLTVQQHRDAIAANMQQSALTKMAQVLFMAAKEEPRPQMHAMHNPQAYFRPIGEAPAMHGVEAMQPGSVHEPHMDRMVDNRVLSTPSPLLPPPSPIFYGDYERAMYEELSGFLRRSASPSLFPMNSSPALAMFQVPTYASSSNNNGANNSGSTTAQRVASPLGAPSSAFQRPGQ